MTHQRIRVLQLVWRLSRGGGAPVVVRRLLEHVDHGRFDMHVCTVRPADPDDRLEEVDTDVTLHPLGLTGSATPLLRARAVLGVARVVRSVRPHVLHVHSGTAWYAIPAALATRQISRIIEVHDAPQSNRLSPGNLRLERLMHERLGFRPLVHSSAVRDGVAEAWSLPPESIDLVPLGIDVDAFRTPERTRSAVREALALPEQNPLVLYVARLVPEKRPELFIEVADRVRRQRPDTVFALVGTGSELDRMRELVDTKGLSGAVAVPGFADDLPSTYHAADLFLSTSRYEGFGLAIAEAMASGLPVVSTHVGGVEDVIGDAGMLEASGDPDHLAAAVVRLLDDRDARASLGRMASARARDVLDTEVTARGFEDAYGRGGNT